MVALTPAELSSLAQPIYGPRWQSALAREMSVAVRTAQRWARDGVERQTTADGVRRFLEERARQVVSPPAISGDRDAQAYAEMRPRIEAMVRAATAVGWHPAEVTTAALAAIIDLMSEGAGAPATMQTLKDAISALKETRGA